jgi:DNA repair protein RecN (Recombination protein N)
LVLGDTIDTVIFDEIDTGISGIAAQKVGEKLAMIADKRQVICITHLPQIAVMGDTNYLIEKYVEADHTKTSLTPLKEQSLYQEISRMMGGLVTDTTLESAKELRDKAQSYKKSFR